MFHDEKYNGIIEQLTEAVENGTCKNTHPPPYLHHCITLHTYFARTGTAVYVPHALLLRGSMYALFRQDSSALKDFQAVINTKDLFDQVHM